jgi:tetratricopeptide (TPR) repeat protein
VNPLEEDKELALLEAERLMEFGRLEQDQGNPAEARLAYEEARSLFQIHGSQSGEARALGNIGVICRIQNQYERAMEFNMRAIDLAREVGDRHTEGINLGNLGIIYREQGLVEQAAEVIRQSLKTCREVGDRRTESIILGNLGSIYLDQGKHDEAVEIYMQVVQICREYGDKRVAATNLGNLGVVCQTRGQYERAIDFYLQAIETYRALGDKRSEGVAHGNMGDALLMLERFEESETAVRTGIGLLEQRYPMAAGVFRGSLGLILARRGESVEALSVFDSSEAVVRTYPEEHAKFHCKKGQVCHLAGDACGAQAALTQAREIAVELKVREDSELGQAVARLEAVLSVGPPE